MKHLEKTPGLNKTVEVASGLVLPVATATAAIYELNASNYINTPFIEQIPGADHSSSVAGGAFVGLVGGAITEKIAIRFDNKGRERTAEQIRRVGNIATLLGSLATQLTIESSLVKGTPDKWDVIAGFVATAPGIITGHALTRSNHEKS